MIEKIIAQLLFSLGYPFNDCLISLLCPIFPLIVSCPTTNIRRIRTHLFINPYAVIKVSDGCR